MDEEPIALLPEIFNVVGQKHGSVVALTVQYHSVLVQAISGIFLLVSFAKAIPCHPLNVIVVMFDLSMGPRKQKEEWKSVLMATGLLLVMATG